jgi:diadenosine tetraphosphate (Ap4A) HIT family hydrolase
MSNKYSKDNIFWKIIQGKFDCQKVFEDENFLAIYDKYPRYEKHILLLTKKEFVSFDDFLEKSTEIEIGLYFKTLKHVINLENLSEKGFKILTNHQQSMGQEIFHFHAHIMSGKILK